MIHRGWVILLTGINRDGASDPGPVAFCQHSVEAMVQTREEGEEI